MKFLVQPLSRLTLITFACIYRRERGGGGGAAQREEASEGEVILWKYGNERTISYVSHTGQQRPKRQSPPLPSPAAIPEATSTAPRQVTPETTIFLTSFPLQEKSGEGGDVPRPQRVAQGKRGGEGRGGGESGSSRGRGK